MRTVFILFISFSLFPLVGQEKGGESPQGELQTYVFPVHGQGFQGMFSASE